MPQIHELPESLQPDEYDKFIIETSEGVAKYIEQSKLFGGLVMQNNTITRNLKYVPDYTTYTNTSPFGTSSVVDIYVYNGVIFVVGNGVYYSVDDGATWTHRTTADGLGSNSTYSIYVNGTYIFIGTLAGLSISTDGGASFTNKTTTHGLGSNQVNDVHYSGTTLYAATEGGLSISTDNGLSFTNKTISDGLYSNVVKSVYAQGDNIYCGTGSGLSIPSSLGGLNISTDGGTSFGGNNNLYSLYSVSTIVDIEVFNNVIYFTANYGGTGLGFFFSSDGGTTFTRKLIADGLGSNITNKVSVISGIIAVSTQGGLSISTDDGVTFTNYTTADGLGDNNCNGLFNDTKRLYVGSYTGIATYFNKSNTSWVRLQTGTGTVLEYDIADNAFDIYTAPTGAAGSVATLTKRLLLDETHVALTDDLSVGGDLSITSNLTVDTNLIKTDSVNNRVGINKTTPAKSLDVVGNGEFTTDLTVGTNLTVDTNLIKTDSVNNRVGINKTTPAKTLDVAGNGEFTTDLTVGTNLSVSGDYTSLLKAVSAAEIASYIRMMSGGNEMAFIRNGTTGRLEFASNARWTGAAYILGYEGSTGAQTAAMVSLDPTTGQIYFYNYNGTAGDTITSWTGNGNGAVTIDPHSLIAIGINRSASGSNNATYQLYADGAAGTTLSAKLERIYGTNGALNIANRGTGAINFYGSDLATLLLSLSSAGVISGAVDTPALPTVSYGTHVRIDSVTVVIRNFVKVNKQYLMSVAIGGTISAGATGNAVSVLFSLSGYTITKAEGGINGATATTSDQSWRTFLSGSTIVVETPSSNAEGSFNCEGIIELSVS